MKKDINPLLEPFGTPYDSVPFDRIKPSHFEPAFRKLIQKARKEFRKVIEDKEEPTFLNTILPIEQQYEHISRLGLILFNINSANTSLEIQAVTQRVSPLITRFMGQLMLDHDYFNRVSTIYCNSDKYNLTREELRLVEITYKTMKRNGADLDNTKKKKLIRIQIRLSKLNLKFKENVLAETNQFELHITNPKDLDGLTESVVEGAASVAKDKKKEGWIFTLQFPSYSAFMKFSNKRELREIIYRAYTSKGNHANEHDNRKIIKEIVNLRLQQASLLGYDNYAKYALEDRMAEMPLTVNKFLKELHSASKTFALKELSELKNFIQEQGINLKIMPWDFSYYSEKLKTNRYNFDEEIVKPYFKLDSVIKGVFGLASTLYKISFKEVTNIQVYNPDVMVFEVNDEDGSFLGILYADFYPRDNKQNGAWMTEFLAQSNIDGMMIRPHISICTNFTKPTERKPSLLTFNEVNTFLHEFGHALHGLFANTVYPSLSGTNVYRDFVELPSQLMENWLTETDWISTFAFHYETGEPMPDELVQRLIDSRNFQSGYMSERQLSFGFLDMYWHQLSEPVKDDVVLLERAAIADTQLLPDVEGSSVSTSFSHIFSGGYAAGYYSYKWAEVLEADAFSLFKEQGIFNQEVAGRFRKEILEKGGTANPMELYLNFRGKEPTIDALLKRSGLK